MKKLTKWLTWIDENLLFLTLAAFTLATALVPKIPLFHVNYTYIKIRYDDFFIVPVFLIYLIQLLRRKAPIRLNFALPIALFWGAVLLSCLVGIYISETIPVHFQGYLHFLRRIQYMLIFFVALSGIDSEKRFMNLMKIYFIGVFIVSLYGIGQKFLPFPSIQSMNPAYVDGRILVLGPEDRINSTFGGHFDLAAYLVFSIPLLLGFFFYYKKIKYFLLYALSLTVLLYTAARSSFIGYLGSITLFLLYTRKFLFYGLIIVLTAVLLLITGDMTKRIRETFQVKTVFVNTTTGTTTIDQKISIKSLPAGNLSIKLPKGVTKSKTKVNQNSLAQAAYEEAANEAKYYGGGKKSQEEIEKRAQEIAKVLKPQQMLLCDISCSTRLQVEWPRAIGAFLFNPFFGTGPYSLGEATDNSFLRWLGEFGLLGTSIFLYLIFLVAKTIWKSAKAAALDKKYIYYGYIFALISLLINALYVDAFEASKMAYNFWLVTGFYIGLTSLSQHSNSKK